MESPHSWVSAVQAKSILPCMKKSAWQRALLSIDTKQPDTQSIVIHSSIVHQPYSPLIADSWQQSHKLSVASILNERATALCLKHVTQVRLRSSCYHKRDCTLTPPTNFAHYLVHGKCSYTAWVSIYHQRKIWGFMVEYPWDTVMQIMLKVLGLPTN